MTTKFIIDSFKKTNLWNKITNDENTAFIILGGSQGLYLNDLQSDYDIFIYSMANTIFYEPSVCWKYLEYHGIHISLSIVSIRNMLTKQSFQFSTGMTKNLETIQNKKILYKTNGKYKKIADTILSEKFSMQLVKLGTILTYECLTNNFINDIKNNNFLKYYNNCKFKQIYSLIYIGNFYTKNKLDKLVFNKIKRFKFLKKNEIHNIIKVLNDFFIYSENHLNDKYILIKSLNEELWHDN